MQGLVKTCLECFGCDLSILLLASQSSFTLEDLSPQVHNGHQQRLQCYTLSFSISKIKATWPKLAGLRAFSQSVAVIGDNLYRYGPESSTRVE